MISVEGTKIERSNVNVNVQDREIIRSLKNKIGLRYSKDRDYEIREQDGEVELGYWQDEDHDDIYWDRYWVDITRDKNIIEVFKAIQVMEKFLKENNEDYNHEY